MKKVLLAALMAGVASSAMAADLPTRKAPPRLRGLCAPPVFSWTGFYVGVNGGWGGGTNGGDFGSPTGGLVGGTVGYNYQVGQFVAGLEGDWDWADLNKNGVNGLGPYQQQGRLAATARARAGVALDRALLLRDRRLRRRGGQSQRAARRLSRRPTGAAAARSAAASNTPSPTTSRPRPSTSTRPSRARSFRPVAKSDLDLSLVRAGLNYKF